MIQALTQPSLASSSAYPVREACMALGVSSSGFYAHGHKTEHSRRREELTCTRKRVPFPRRVLQLK